ncbi:MAG: hypothetical protein QFB86_01415 [Patescibacteria group bacterium]|nr:hypothetical protein [Patescibacteria group bacterium]
MENLTITKNDQLSLNDLVELQAQGFSVLRSAHIGNLSPYNMSIAALGIPLLCVDHTITGIDTNYFPELTLSSNDTERVTRDGLVVCRAIVDAKNVTTAKQKQFVDELQLSSVRAAIPEANVFTNTEYLRKNESVVSEIVAIAVANFPEQFTRLALADGATRRDQNAARRISDVGVMQLNDNPRASETAVILPNLVDIMANFVIEALDSEQAIQYHLSGPDMVRYINNLVPDMQRFYVTLKSTASFRNLLPKQLSVEMIPSAEARFATTARRQPNLEGLLSVLQQTDQDLLMLAGKRKQFFTSTPKNKEDEQVFSATIKTQQSKVELEIAEVAQLVPELFVPAGSTGFVTQNDVLAEGGLFIAPINRELSMAELSKTFKRLVKLRERIRL